MYPSQDVGRQFRQDAKCRTEELFGVVLPSVSAEPFFAPAREGSRQPLPCESSPVHGSPPRRSEPLRDPFSPKQMFAAFSVLPGRAFRPEEMFAVRFRFRGPNPNDRGVIMMAENKDYKFVDKYGFNEELLKEAFAEARKIYKERGSCQ